AKEICISSTPHETRLAILEDDQLAEIYYERENEYTLAGSIYNGRVTRVLPGMQSAFVDVGLERDDFLYVTDFMELEDQEETVESEPEAPREIQASAASPRNARPERGERFERAPEPFVLPGESLKKYGGASSESAEKPAFEAPASVRPASTYKPPTLIESPIV